MKKSSEYLMLQTSRSVDTIMGGNSKSSSGNLGVRTKGIIEGIKKRFLVSENLVFYERKIKA